MARIAGAVPVHVTCPQNNGFKLRPEDLDAAITPKTKWLILNLPNNPTGAACSAAELEGIAAVMRKHPHVWIMSDDMYEHLVYDDFAFTTLPKVAPDIAPRILSISGVSKTYAMTGWRIGFAAGPKELIAGMVSMQGHATAGVSSVGQAAAVAALEGPQDIVGEMRAIYKRRRDMVVDALNAIPGISCHRPEGAFYVFPNIAGLLGRTTAKGARIETDADFAEALLDEAHVALVHGGAFGMSPYLRISYATDDASLARAMERIATFVHSMA
jgi:aspartate aminotransferase